MSSSSLQWQDPHTLSPDPDILAPTDNRHNPSRLGRRDKGKGKAFAPEDTGEASINHHPNNYPYPHHSQHRPSPQATTLSPSPILSPSFSQVEGEPEIDAFSFTSHISHPTHSHSFSSSSRYLSPASTSGTGEGSNESTPNFVHSVPQNLPAPPPPTTGRSRSSFSSLFVGGGGLTGSGMGRGVSSSGESSEANTPLSAEAGYLAVRRESKGRTGEGIIGWNGADFAHAVGVGLGNLDASGYQDEDMGVRPIWNFSANGGYVGVAPINSSPRGRLEIELPNTMFSNGAVPYSPTRGVAAAEGLLMMSASHSGRRMSSVREELARHIEDIQERSGSARSGIQPSGSPDDALRRPMFALPIEDLIGGFEGDDLEAMQHGSALSPRWGDDMDIDVSSVGGSSRVLDGHRHSRNLSLGELSTSSASTFQDAGSARMWRRDVMGLPTMMDEGERDVRRSSASVVLNSNYYGTPNINATGFIAPPLTEFTRLAEAESARSMGRVGIGKLPDAIDPNVFASPGESSAARMPSPELNEDSETDAPMPPSPTSRPKTLADLPPLKRVGIPGPAFPRRMGQKRPTLPPPPPPSGSGPSAFPALAANLREAKDLALPDGMKVLARGFSKGNENSIPGAMYVCENCGETHTPLWRRSEKNELLCNACGLYVRTHHQHRPIDQAVAARERRLNDVGHRKRKIKAVCDSCKPIPEEDRDASCADCAEILRVKEESAARRRARMLKQAQATEALALEAGFAFNSEVPVSPPELDSSFASTSPVMASWSGTPSKASTNSLGLPSVGGRRGKQPPGAGVQPPRGGSGSSSISISSPSAPTTPPAKSSPAKDEEKPKSTGPTRIRIKRKIATDTCTTLVPSIGRGKNFAVLAAGQHKSISSRSAQPSIKLITKSASSPALSLISSTAHASGDGMHEIGSPVKRRKVADPASPSENKKGSKGWAWIPISPPPAEDQMGEEREERVVLEGLEIDMRDSGSPKPGSRSGSERATRHKKRTMSVTFAPSA